MNAYPTATDVEYQDTQVMYWGIPLMTLFVVHVGIEEGLGALLTNALYYENLIVSLAIAYLTFFSIRACIIGFDQWMPWRENRNTRRWLFQLVTCSLITAFWLLVNDCYDYIMLGEPELFDRLLLRVDLPVCIALMAGLNYYYFVQFREVHRLSKSPLLSTPKEQSHAHILLKMPNGYHQAQTDDIQLAYLENKLTSLVDQEGKKRRFDLSLAALERELGSKAASYFRINRKLLIHKTAVKGYRKITGHRLQLELRFPTSVPPIVSKNKAARFKSWWHQIPSD